MSIETNIEADNIQTDEDILIDASEDYDFCSASVKQSRFRAPAIIALILLVISVIFFIVWGLFFNKAIKGTWKYSVTVNNENKSTEYNYVLNFEDNGICRYNLGGTTYTGKYKSEYVDGKHKLNMVFTMIGTEIYNNNLIYDVSGNIFTGRKLELTDIDGMILPPDNLSSETKQSVELKSKLADSKEENGIRYYILPFESIDSIEPEIDKYDDFKTDEKLTGIWYEANERSGYGYTFTFNEDGSYELTYSDVSYAGCYSAENGKCDYNLVFVDGKTDSRSFNYSFSGENLIIEINGQKSTLIKTDNKYAFKSEIK